MNKKEWKTSIVELKREINLLKLEIERKILERQLNCVHKFEIKEFEKKTSDYDSKIFVAICNKCGYGFEIRY